MTFIAEMRHNSIVTETADFPSDDFADRRDDGSGWLPAAEFANISQQIPLVYIDAVPVRVDESGDGTEVGLLLRVSPENTMTRALVSGRVLYHERIRDAIVRHIEKDLGPMALPQVPPSPQPFTVAEYFPTMGVSPYYDPRHHAVSLAYIVPVAGECAPQSAALDLAWITPEQACSPRVQREMTGGQGTLLLQAMAHIGRIGG